MNEADLIAQQDAQRTSRSFISFLSAALGVNDQSYPGQDGYSYNPPRQYQSIGLNGAVGVEGMPRSNMQTQAVMMSPAVLLLGAVVIGYLVLKK